MRQTNLKKLRRLTKSNEFFYFECLGQFDGFLFKNQFSNFCNSFIPDFEKLHNLIHLNDFSETKIIFDDSSISDSEYSENCETTSSSIVKGKEAEMYDGRLKVNLQVRMLLICLRET